MMVLTVDVGNTQTKIGAFDKDELRFVARFSTNALSTADQYAVELSALLSLYHVSPADFDGAMIGAVVPAVGVSMRDAIGRLCGITPLMVGPGIKSGLNIRIDEPSGLGADLVEAAVAALAAYPLPCVIFSLGTATTVGVLDGSGCFIGGLLMAGVEISLDALAARTAQLPRVALGTPRRVIGTNTTDCMRAGFVYGTAAMLDGFCARIEEELGETVFPVATGGLAAEITPYCQRDIRLNENLVQYGLHILYERNR